MPHAVDIHVGKMIRQQRCMVGMTQQQLADKVGIRFQQIQKYETGMNRVSASRLWDIADVLGVAISFFFEGLKTSFAPIEIDKGAVEMMSAYMAVDPPQSSEPEFPDAGDMALGMAILLCLMIFMGVVIVTGLAVLIRSVL